MKFKKIFAAIGSTIMLGATIAGAFAANYPAPFSTQGAQVVYGASAPGNNDLNAATMLQQDLLGKLVSTGGTVSVSGGDSYKVEGSSDKWNLGENATQFRSGKITKNDLPGLLKDGVFRDADNN